MRRLAFVIALLLALPAHAQPALGNVCGFRPGGPARLVVVAAKTKGVAPQLAADFDEALRLDFRAVGLFKVLDRKDVGDVDPAHLDPALLARLDADLLVESVLTAHGDSVAVEARMYERPAQTELMKIVHAVPAAQTRRLAHAVVDDILDYFTRVPGPFESRIAYAKRNGNAKEIWISDWDGHFPVRVTSGELDFLPAITRDRDGVAFTSFRSGKPQLYVQKLGGKAQLLVKSPQMASGVAFSPDGTRIAYTLGTNEGTAVWTANADGTHAKRITDAPGINASPTWSPDGKQIAFVSNRGGSPQIYLMNADGSNTKRLTFAGKYNQTPTWSPRGGVIAFTAQDERGVLDLFTVDVASGRLTRLTQNQGDNQEPSFSPDGRLIVFASTRGGSSRLWVTTLDGNTQTPLELEPGVYATPDWGP